MPEVNQFFIINRAWFSANELFNQYVKLEPQIVYKILEVKVLSPEFPDDWGITLIQNFETEEIINFLDYPALEDYWCLFDKDDSIRILTEI